MERALQCGSSKIELLAVGDDSAQQKIRPSPTSGLPLSFHRSTLRFREGVYLRMRRAVCLSPAPAVCRSRAVLWYSFTDAFAVSFFPRWF
jgi:hypothetical protein